MPKATKIVAVIVIGNELHPKLYVWM